MNKINPERQSRWMTTWGACGGRGWPTDCRRRQCMCWWRICSVLTGADVGTGIETPRLNRTVRTGTFTVWKPPCSRSRRSQSPVPTLKKEVSICFFGSTLTVRFSSNEWLSKIIIFKETAINMEIKHKQKLCDKLAPPEGTHSFKPND